MFESKEPKSINSGSVRTSEHLHFVCIGPEFRSVIVLLQECNKVFLCYCCLVVVVVVVVVVEV